MANVKKKENPKKKPSPKKVPDAKENPSNPVSVVGIGASAGGLEALERFFKALPSHSDLAFVIVQHLDPDHKSLLAELLQRHTIMPVNQALDGIQVQANEVYIIPPNHDLAIHNGRLFLLEPTARRGMRLPIDYFLRSLAQEQGEFATAVVLSGTGTDGTLGVRAVKGEGGLVLAQEPKSATYEGMPASAIATGLVDIIDIPEKLPGRLLAYMGRMFQNNRVPKKKPHSDDRLNKILLLIRRHTGHDFSQYKQATLVRRIERRMVINKLDGLEQFITLLTKSNSEITALFHELLIGVTAFFRDLEAFEQLQQQIIPELLLDRGGNDSLRMWIPACSTGEEAYSIAVLVRQYLEDNQLEIPVQIFATDIDDMAIDVARAAIYPESISADVPESLLKRYFSRQGSSWRLNKNIREMVVFATQNVVKDPPFSSLDFISCRNLLIYFQNDLQKQVLDLFHYVLRTDGYLFLGSAESISTHAERFRSKSKKWRIFQSRGRHQALKKWPNKVQSTLIPPSKAKNAEPEKNTLRHDIRHFTQKTLLEKYSPVAIMVDGHANILYVQGRTGYFLEATSGDSTLNVIELARGGLKPALVHALRELDNNTLEIYTEGVRVESDGGDRLCDLHVNVVLEPANMIGFRLIILEDKGLYPLNQEVSSVGENHIPRVTRLEKELKDTRTFLNTTIEELESTNEELTSTNEELQSANEEMQSGNEELQTSQEELRSVNEELVTVNTELQTKVDELDKANNDLANLMNSTELAIVFLDMTLCVKRFTPAATRLLHLLKSDIGRPLEHTANDLDYPNLAQDVEAMLDTLIPSERELKTRDGHWYLLRIRPYRTSDNMINGAVLTFIDIHEQKKGEELKRLTRAIEQSPVCVIITDAQGTIEYVNPRFSEVSGWAYDEVIGKNTSLLQSGEHSEAFYADMWQTLSTGQVWRGDFRNRRKNGELFWSEAIISAINDSNGKITHYVGVQQDATTRRHMENELRTSEVRYRNLVEHMSSGVAVYKAEDKGSDFTFLEFNQAAEKIEDIEREHVIGKSVLECFPGIKEFGLFEVLQRVWRNGQPEQLPLRYYHDNRITGWRHNYVYQLPRGELVAIYEDVTEKKLAENALKASEELHRLTLGNISDAVFITDNMGQFTFVCPNVANIFGFSETEIKNDYTIFKLLGDNFFDLRELECTGELSNLECCALNKKGMSVELLVNVKRVNICGGSYLYTCHDISDYNKMKHSLQQTKERYELTMQLANIGAWDWDIQSGKLDWSDTIEAMFGFSPGEFRGTYEAFLDCIHPEDKNLVLDAIQAALGSETDYQIEHRIVRPDGSVHRVLEKGGVLHDKTGNPVRMVGIVYVLSK